MTYILYETEKVPSLQNLNKAIVGVGKHLCGGATGEVIKIRSSGNADSHIIMTIIDILLIDCYML